ncbi:MOSC domain-containing protein [Streptomyces collinus]|uniref:MOSC domain-containing protein n=1 Tax=Streptomyces collinus TaxID=42684 RepID=UPI0038035615
MRCRTTKAASRTPCGRRRSWTAPEGRSPLAQSRRERSSTMAGSTGVYLDVLEPGTVRLGDPIRQQDAS